jgi:hypothetical protein
MHCLELVLLAEETGRHRRTGGECLAGRHARPGNLNELFVYRRAWLLEEALMRGEFERVEIAHITGLQELPEA